MRFKAAHHFSDDKVGTNSRLTFEKISMQQKLLNAEYLRQHSTLGHYHNTCTRQVNGLKISKNHLLQLFRCLFKEKVKKGKSPNRFKLIVYFILTSALRFFSIHQTLTDRQRSSPKNNISAMYHHC